MHNALLLGDVVHRSHALSDHAALVLCAAVHKNATLRQARRAGTDVYLESDRLHGFKYGLLPWLLCTHSRARLYLSYGCLRLSLHFRGALQG